MKTTWCQIELSVAFVDASGDGVWSSGEAGEVQVTMATPVDNFDYPGLLLEASEPSIPPQTIQLFGVAADTPALLSFAVLPDPPLQVGTVVTFTATVAPLRMCGPELPSLAFDVLVE
jgi:hypothetical protein